jgi:dTDP-glucose pyrophosphorylase
MVLRKHLKNYINGQKFKSLKLIKKVHRNRNITLEHTLLEAFKKMDVLDKKLLIVLDNDKFAGLLSAGDIQRAVIQNKSLDIKVEEILRKNIRIATPSDKFDVVKKMMLEFRMELCPVVNLEKEIVEVYFWEDIFVNQEMEPFHNFDLPVIIMAGGYGTRLRPLTHVIPKPLIPIKDKTMLEEIFMRFSKYGSNRFFVSINYKAELIKYYLKEQRLDYNIKYFVEEQPMGTAGSLSLLKNIIKETFFVTNCDILIEEDYSEILEYHQKNNNEITVVAALKNYEIPYGTIETKENGELIKLEEKPDLTIKINSGMYILEPHLIQEIPDDDFFHITHLIEKVKERDGKVGVFPVSEKSWMDMGEWEKYIKMIN